MSEPLLTATEIKSEIDSRSNLYDEPTRSAFLLGAAWGAQAVRKKMEARAQPAQAGQVLSDEKLWEMWVESPSDVLRFARAIEAAVLAKRVPMTTRRVTYTCPACHFSLERAE